MSLSLWKTHPQPRHKTALTSPERPSRWPSGFVSNWMRACRLVKVVCSHVILGKTLFFVNTQVSLTLVRVVTIAEAAWDFCNRHLQCVFVPTNFPLLSRLAERIRKNLPICSVRVNVHTAFPFVTHSSATAYHQGISGKILCFLCTCYHHNGERFENGVYVFISRFASD